MPWGVILAWGIVAAGLCFFFRSQVSPPLSPPQRQNNPMPAVRRRACRLFTAARPNAGSVGSRGIPTMISPRTCPHPNATWPVKEHVQ